MKYIHDIVMYKGPSLEVNQEKTDNIKKLLRSSDIPQFIEIDDEMIAVSNIAQIVRRGPERLPALPEPTMSEEDREKNLQALDETRERLTKKGIIRGKS